jgi:hypothetical protein
LPLPAEAVATVFRAQRLVWTVNDALCVLAHADPDRLAAPRPPLPPWIDRPPVAAARPAPLPRLTPRVPQPAQLALFD